MVIDQKDGHILFWKLILIALIASLLLFIPWVGTIVSIFASSLILYHWTSREWHNAFWPSALAVVIAKIFLFGVAVYLVQQAEKQQQIDQKEMIEFWDKVQKEGKQDEVSGPGSEVRN